MNRLHQRIRRTYRKNSGQESTAHAADTMKLEHFQSIIDAQPFIDLLEQADDDRSEEADHSSVPGSDITSSRSNSDKPGDSALARTDDGELTSVEDVVIHRPTDHTGRSSHVRVPDGDHAAKRGVQRRATVKPKPTEPDQHGTNKDDGDVVRLVVCLLAETLALAEEQSVCQTSAARADVHRPAAGKVERTELE